MAATVLLTPQLAGRWLHGGYPGGDGATVARYVDEMTAGRWRPGSPIILTQSGRIVDGLHRVRAVWISKVTIEVEVSVYDAP